MNGAVSFGPHTSPTSIFHQLRSIPNQEVPLHANDIGLQMCINTLHTFRRGQADEARINDVAAEVKVNLVAS